MTLTPLIKLAIVAALLSALFGLERYIEHRGYTRAQLEAQTAIDQIKRSAANTLAAETAKTRQAEQALQAFTDFQNGKDSDHEKTVTALAARLRAVADPAGRLRDPNATGCGGGGGSTQATTASAAGAGAADAALPGGLLSAELSGLLRERLEQADRINDAYASCRALMVQERELLKN